MNKDHMLEQFNSRHPSFTKRGGTSMSHFPLWGKRILIPEIWFPKRWTFSRSTDFKQRAYEMLELYKRKGGSLRSIAKAYNCSWENVRLAMKKYWPEEYKEAKKAKGSSRTLASPYVTQFCLNVFCNNKKYQRLLRVKGNRGRCSRECLFSDQLRGRSHYSARQKRKFNTEKTRRYYHTPNGRAAMFRVREKQKLDPFYKKKLKARTVVSTSLRWGNIRKKPCEVCQNPEVIACIPDLDQPLKVMWRCRAHKIKFDYI